MHQIPIISNSKSEQISSAMARALALHESAVPVCRGLGFGVRVSVRAYASPVGASRLLVPSAPVGKW